MVRGRPLADVAFEPWAESEIATIQERILDATEARIDADLALGRHAKLVTEIEALAGAHPYRERLLELSMLALYRSGRQVDALAAYRRGGAHLRNELGLSPGRTLQQLEAAILRQDPALDAPPSSPSESVRTRTRHGRTLALAGALAVVVAIVAAAVLVTREDTASLESLPPGVAILSATDGSLLAQISTDTIPEPAEVIKGGGSFWVWNLKPFSMVEIRPQTGEILRRVGSPFSGDADGFTIDGRDIWFTGARDLVRVDSGTGQAVDRFRLAGANHHLGLGTPARCAGKMWVANNDGNVLLRVNPETGAIGARIPMPSPWGLACGGGAVWVTSNFAGDVRRVDTRTNEVTGIAQTPPSSSIAYGAGFAWTSGETDGTVYKIDRRGRVVTTYETGDGARQLSFGAGKLWVGAPVDGHRAPGALAHPVVGETLRDHLPFAELPEVLDVVAQGAHLCVLRVAATLSEQVDGIRLDQDHAGEARAEQRGGLERDGAAEGMPDERDGIAEPVACGDDDPGLRFEVWVSRSGHGVVAP